MTRIELPPELLAKLSEVIGELRESVEPLEASASGRQVLEAIEDLNSLVGRELRVFARVLGTQRYHARVYFFDQVRKGKRSRWQLDSVQLAEAEFVPGGPPHLRALMTAGMQNMTGSGNRMALWIRAMPEVDDDTFFAFLIHSSGFETALSLNQRGWSHMRMGGTALEMTIGSMMRPRRSKMDIWERLTATQVKLIASSARKEFTELWKDHTRSPMTDELWEQFVGLLFTNDEQLMFMHEIGRATAAGLIQESQKLQGALVHLVENMLDEHKELASQREKTHARALAKFKTDLERYRGAKDVATNRLKQVEREAQQLREQLKQAAANSTNGGVVSRQSIGVTLDRFFS